jgi:molybdopterin converting factor subunit 1
MKAVTVAGAKGDKTIRVQYFAVLREWAGCSTETLTTNATTPASLYGELSLRHAFKLERDRLKVAVNAEFANWHSPLLDGDHVAFIPPVAGG